MKKIILSLMFILAFGACKDQKADKQQAKPIVKFAALYPLSGDGAQYGKTAQEVSEMFLEDFAKSHPDSKYDYQVLFEDVQFSTAKTATAMRKVVDIDKVSAVFAITSSQGMVINPIAEKNKVIQLSYAVDSNVAEGKYNFTISTSIPKIADMTLAKMKKNNVKKVAFITLASDIGSIKVAEKIASKLKENDIENVGEYMINPQETDFLMILESIRKSKPDLIVFESLPPTADLVLYRMKALNMDIPVTGIWTLTSLNDKTLAEGFWFVDDGEATKEFVDRYTKRVETKGTHYGEYLYTMLTVLTNAFEKTPASKGKIPDTSDVVETMMKTTKGMSTALGILDINENGEIGLSGTYKKIQDGKPVPLEE